MYEIFYDKIIKHWILEAIGEQFCFNTKKEAIVFLKELKEKEEI